MLISNATRNRKMYSERRNIYYCMTGRAIQGNFPFEIDCIGPTKGRDDTEVENGIFPHIIA